MNRERLIEGFTWSPTSLARINTCDDRIVLIAEWVIQYTPIDQTIIHGYRGQQEQDALHRAGLSKLHYPLSKHNVTRVEDGHDTMRPWSQAIDFAPYPIDWKDERAFALCAGVWMSCAKSLGHELRWGGDWDGDGSTMDQSFMDIGHLELVV